MQGNSGRGMVFVTGSVRSGTTAVRASLGAAIGMRPWCEHSFGRNYASIGEMAPRPAERHDAHGGCLGRPKGDEEWPRFALHDGLTRELSQAIAEEKASHWIGFAPDFDFPAYGVKSVSRIAASLPEARFIFCRRNGVANVESRMRRWPETPFLAHCVAWATIMDEWRRVRPEVGDRSIEVDQLNMLREPETVGDGIAGLMELDEEPGDALVRALACSRPARNGEGPASYKRLDEVDWPVDRKLAFIAVCHTQMQGFGYEAGFPEAKELSATLLTLDSRDIEIERRHTDFAPWALLGFPGGFQLHPAAGHAPPPTLVFRDVPSWGPSALRGTLMNVHPEAPTVEFDLRVRMAGTERVVYAKRFSVGPVAAVHIHEAFDAGLDNVDVEIATRPASSYSNRNAWARVAGLRVTPAGALA